MITFAGIVFLYFTEGAKQVREWQCNRDSRLDRPHCVTCTSFINDEIIIGQVELGKI